MRTTILLFLFLCTYAAQAQRFDFSAGAGITLVAKQVDAPINEKLGTGNIAVRLRAMRTGRILYYGASLGIYRLATPYTMPAPFPDNERCMVYASPAIEANLHLGKRFSFADNAIDIGITAGAAFHKANGVSTSEISYVGNYKPLLVGIEAGYTHYLNMVGIGISTNPHLSNSIHEENLNLIVIPVTLDVHLRL
jgi:hypothetical protein